MNVLDKHILIKQKFPSILEKNMGMISKACKQAHIDYNTYRKWAADDKEFAQDCKDAYEVVGDFVESKLYETINEKNPQTIMFYCRTRLKDRGYGEKKEEETPIWAEKEMEHLKKQVDKLVEENKRDY